MQLETLRLLSPALFVGLLSSAAAPPVGAEPAGELRERAAPIFGELPKQAVSESNPITEPKVELGRMLYYDPRLSKNHDISCNSCHKLDAFGVDGEATSPGHRGQRGGRNSPTVYNAALQLAQFWDGRAPDVEEQAKGPILNPIEMASPSEKHVVMVLHSIPGYRPLFQAAFAGESEPITYDNMARAIAAFERELMTPSRFDRFLAGDPDALTEAEQRGLARFIDTGCVTCHLGPIVGGSMYRKLGLVNVYLTSDPGRFDVTGKEADRHVFKVAPLRNVVKTGPYFHDGSIGTLPEAVRKMAYHQLGRSLNDAEVEEIVVFLGSLTGEVDPAFVAMPELPESSDATPKPDPS